MAERPTEAGVETAGQNGSASATDESEGLRDYIDQNMTEHDVDIVALSLGREAGPDTSSAAPSECERLCKTTSGNPRLRVRNTILSRRAGRA
ncbi:hypothetical protein [Streptomyces griseosporeus]|uniref:hypothetical protein n=1 Tax=Streptomyces griseosporeus TaxID=1910 RepID=UPI00167EF516|nr:hypothetical protein [Streptomyces griseosporeus]GHF36128.1 hypothetical protein GCM10018783_00490 [Streptomyces griseosporeus]